MKRTSILYFFCFLMTFFVLIFGCSKKDAPQSNQSQNEAAIPSQQTTDSSGMMSVTSGVQSGSSNLEKSIRVEVTPSVIKRFDTIRISVSGVPNGATISYEWAKNGSRLSESGSSLYIGDDFKRGDRIDCAVKVEASGHPSIWYVSGFVANAPPVFESSPTVMHVQERTYKITVKASDPDGDPISFLLKQPVEGATINSSTGEIDYIVPQNKKDAVTFLIAAQDGHGGETVYTVKFDLQSP
jgi:hypothetical protein